MDSKSFFFNSFRSGFAIFLICSRFSILFLKIPENFFQKFSRFFFKKSFKRLSQKKTSQNFFFKNSVLERDFSCFFIIHKVRVKKKYHTTFEKYPRKKGNCVLGKIVGVFWISLDNGSDFQSLEFRALTSTTSSNSF